MACTYYTESMTEEVMDMAELLTWEEAQAIAQANKVEWAEVTPWGWGDERYFVMHQFEGDNYEVGSFHFDRRTRKILREDSVQVIDELRPRSRRFAPYGDFTNAPGWEHSRVEDYYARQGNDVA